MLFDDIFSQLKNAGEELDFARLQFEGAKRQVSIAEKRVKELVTQLSKATGVPRGNNSKVVRTTYTEEDDTLLRTLWSNGGTARSIAEQLNKKTSSVNARIVRLGLTRRPRGKAE